MTSELDSVLAGNEDGEFRDSSPSRANRAVPSDNGAGSNPGFSAHIQKLIDDARTEGIASANALHTRRDAAEAAKSAQQSLPAKSCVPAFTWNAEMLDALRHVNMTVHTDDWYKPILQVLSASGLFAR